MRGSNVGTKRHEIRMMGGDRLIRTRSAFSAALLAGALFAAPASAQTLDLSDLPPEARLPGMKLNFQAVVAGTHVFRCVQTDVVGQYAWYLIRSAGTLTDAKDAPIGETEIGYSGAPSIRTEAKWSDANGASINSSEVRQGSIPGAPDLQWRCYHVQAVMGAGPLARTTYVLRITPWKVLPYSSPCDQGRANQQVSSPFQATDLFTFGVLPPPD